MNGIDLDQIDLEIMRLLQEDAWMSSKRIAHALQRGNTTIHARITRLKKLGFISGSVALINHHKFGSLLIAYIFMSLTDHGADALTEFQNVVVKFEEVQECFHMAGAVDFLMKVAVMDMSGYSEFLSARLSRVGNIGSLQSHFVIQEVKKNMSFPVKKLNEIYKVI